MTDDQALDAIAWILTDPEWAPGMLEDIGNIVAATGREIATVTVDGEAVRTWDRH
jgi:hypothetical protein